MNTPTPASLRVASEALRDADGNVYLALALKVAALLDAEREACAKVADEAWDGWGQKGDRAETAARIAAAIRQRGEL